jgi:hypothetical protein
VNCPPFKNWISRIARRVALAVALLGASAVVLDAPAIAQDNPTRPGAPRPAPVSGKVQVEVLGVYATDTHNRVDPRLQGIIADLRTQKKYTGFDLIDSETSSLGVGQESTFTVAGNRKVKVQLQSRNEQKASVRVRVYNGADKVSLEVTVTIYRNRSFIIAGPRYRDGDLLLPVSVRY